MNTIMLVLISILLQLLYLCNCGHAASKYDNAGLNTIFHDELLGGKEYFSNTATPTISPTIQGSNEEKVISNSIAKCFGGLQSKYVSIKSLADASEDMIIQNMASTSGVALSSTNHAVSVTFTVTLSLLKSGFPDERTLFMTTSAILQGSKGVYSEVFLDRLTTAATMSETSGLIGVRVVPGSFENSNLSVKTNSRSSSSSSSSVSASASVSRTSNTASTSVSSSSGSGDTNIDSAVATSPLSTSDGSTGTGSGQNAGQGYLSTQESASVSQEDVPAQATDLDPSYTQDSSSSSSSSHIQGDQAHTIQTSSQTPQSDNTQTTYVNTQNTDKGSDLATSTQNSESVHTQTAQSASGMEVSELENGNFQEDSQDILEHQGFLQDVTPRAWSSAQGVSLANCNMVYACREGSADEFVAVLDKDKGFLSHTITSHTAYATATTTTASSSDTSTDAQATGTNMASVVVRYSVYNYCRMCPCTPTTVIVLVDNQAVRNHTGVQSNTWEDLSITVTAPSDATFNVAFRTAGNSDRRACGVMLDDVSVAVLTTLDTETVTQPSSGTTTESAGIFGSIAVGPVPTLKPTVTASPVKPTRRPTEALYTRGCPVEVSVYDLFGDGWNGARVVITNVKSVKGDVSYTIEEVGEEVQRVTDSDAPSNTVSIWPSPGSNNAATTALVYVREDVYKSDPGISSIFSVVNTLNQTLRESWEIVWTVKIGEEVYTGDVNTQIVVKCMDVDTPTNFDLSVTSVTGEVKYDSDRDDHCDDKCILHLPLKPPPPPPKKPTTDTSSATQVISSSGGINTDGASHSIVDQYINNAIKGIGRSGDDDFIAPSSNGVISGVNGAGKTETSTLYTNPYDVQKDTSNIVDRYIQNAMRNGNGVGVGLGLGQDTQEGSGLGETATATQDQQTPSGDVDSSAGNGQSSTASYVESDSGSDGSSASADSNTDRSVDQQIGTKQIESDSDKADINTVEVDSKSQQQQEQKQEDQSIMNTDGTNSFDGDSATIGTTTSSKKDKVQKTTEITADTVSASSATSTSSGKGKSTSTVSSTVDTSASGNIVDNYINAAMSGGDVATVGKQGVSQSFDEDLYTQQQQQKQKKQGVNGKDDQSAYSSYKNSAVVDKYVSAALQNNGVVKYEDTGADSGQSQTQAQQQSQYEGTTITSSSGTSTDEMSTGSKQTTQQQKQQQSQQQQQAVLQSQSDSSGTSIVDRYIGQAMGIDLMEANIGPLLPDVKPSPRLNPLPNPKSPPGPPKPPVKLVTSLALEVSTKPAPGKKPTATLTSDLVPSKKTVEYVITDFTRTVPLARGRICPQAAPSSVSTSLTSSASSTFKLLCPLIIPDGDYVIRIAGATADTSEVNTVISFCGRKFGTQTELQFQVFGGQCWPSKLLTAQDFTALDALVADKSSTVLVLTGSLSMSAVEDLSYSLTVEDRMLVGRAICMALADADPTVASVFTVTNLQQTSVEGETVTIGFTVSSSLHLLYEALYSAASQDNLLLNYEQVESLFYGLRDNLASYLTTYSDDPNVKNGQSFLELLREQQMLSTAGISGSTTATALLVTSASSVTLLEIDMKLTSETAGGYSSSVDANGAITSANAESDNNILADLAFYSVFIMMVSGVTVFFAISYIRRRFLRFDNNDGGRGYEYVSVQVQQ